jgi:Flp pilus assembly protein TadD
LGNPYEKIETSLDPCALDPSKRNGIAAPLGTILGIGLPWPRRADKHAIPNTPVHHVSPFFRRVASKPITTDVSAFRTHDSQCRRFRERFLMKRIALIASLTLWAGCQSTGSHATIPQPSTISIPAAGASLNSCDSLRIDEFDHSLVRSPDAPQSKNTLVTNRSLSLNPYTNETNQSIEFDSDIRFDTSSQSPKKSCSESGMTAEEHYLLGIVAQEVADYPQALVDFRRARKLEPAEGEFLAAEIETLAALGRWEEAQSAIESSHHADNSGRLSELRAGLNCIDPVIRSAQSSVAPAENYGLLLVELGRFDEAAEILEPLEQSNQASTVARTALARALLASHQPRQAQFVMERMMRDHANEFEPGHHMMLVHAVVASADTQAARRLLITLGDDRANQGTRLLLQGYLHMQDGETELAVATLKKAAQTQRNDAQVHCLLASIYEHEGNRQLARRHYRLALQIDPHCTQAKKALAKIELKKRRRPIRNPTFS